MPIGIGQNQKKPTPKIGINPNKGVVTPTGKPAPSPHEGEIYNPGVENPIVAPFMTPEDLMAYSAARQQYEEGLDNLDYNFGQKRIETTHEEGNIEKGRVYDRSSANNDLAARGLFRSSIRDGDLADIDATAEIRRKFLSDQMTALKLYTDNRKEDINARWSEYERGKASKEVQNAQGVNANMPKWAVEPGWSKVAPANPGASDKGKGNGGVKLGNPIPKPGYTPPKSNNGGTQAPAPATGGPRVSGKQKLSGAAAMSVAKTAQGRLYG
jgi:hypothetical protein